MTIFCDVCGKILKISKEENKTIGKCNCGFEKELVEISATEIIRKKPEKGKGAVKDENQLATFPHICKHCNHEKAEVIELGVWYSDEAGNIIYKCGKCGKTESDGDNNS